ncbi:MAG: hypothetical protein HY909_28035 [Deltaproteobacteria bacterium]|nr:hypothetical protein [Deltaproteobacteria bacterium]
MAQGSTACAAVTPPPTRLLRQLSLDLRGAPPSPEELAEVSTAGAVTDAMTERLLADPRFVTQVQRWHADLLWPTLEGFYVHPGAGLWLTTGQRGVGRNLGRVNPEALLDILDRRSDEAVCPPSTELAHLTAAACCTAAQPEHPACCLVRNRAYNAEDPACVAKSAALPAAFDHGVATGDRYLRGGPGFLGCDPTLEYPPPRGGDADSRFPRDAEGRPYYVSPRSGQRSYYYDAREVPLPYDDAQRCPGYCRRATGTGPGGALLRGDYAPKQRLDGAVLRVGDGPGYACPGGYLEVVNRCDNVFDPSNEASDVEVRQEGWRLQRPWWSGGHWIKVCAYQAQERTHSAWTGRPCRPGAANDSSCGCGPDGTHCGPHAGLQTRVSRADRRLLDALAREPLELLRTVLERGEDYYTVLTTRRGVANGPLAFMYRHQAEQMQELEFSAPAPAGDLPHGAYADPTWREYQRGPQHSGVLTTAAFLARFPTLRSRINRFRTAFLCHPFIPPDLPTPPPTDACHREPDLARRCGCQHCHTSIEPLGAYWGRWAERSTRYLDPTTFPAYNAACVQCAEPGASCPAACRFYVTAPGSSEGTRFLGRLAAVQYRADDEARRMDEGPAALVAQSLASGELQQCTAQTVWARLLGRPLSDGERARVLPALVARFNASGHDYRDLVRAVVSSPAYRRID